MSLFNIGDVVLLKISNPMSVFYNMKGIIIGIDGPNAVDGVDDTDYLILIPELDAEYVFGYYELARIQ